MEEKHGAEALRRSMEQMHAAEAWSKERHGASRSMEQKEEWSGI
jgi:hypothetical protein